MKRFYYFVIAATSLLMLGSCKKDGSLAEFSVDLENNLIELSYEEQSFSFDIMSAIDWTAESDASWLTVKTTSGEGASDKQKVTIAVEENTTREIRVANVTLTSGDNQLVVKVSQKSLMNYILYKGEVYPIDESVCEDQGNYWFYFYSSSISYGDPWAGKGNWVEIDLPEKTGDFNNIEYGLFRLNVDFDLMLEQQEQSSNFEEFYAEYENVTCSVKYNSASDIYDFYLKAPVQKESQWRAALLDNNENMPEEYVEVFYSGKISFVTPENSGSGDWDEEEPEEEEPEEEEPEEEEPEE